MAVARPSMEEPAAEAGELLRPSPVAASPPRALPPLQDPPTPKTPTSLAHGEQQQQQQQQHVPIKAASRRGCCRRRRTSKVTEADAAKELDASVGSPRAVERTEARETNRPIWEPVCGLMWTLDGAHWTNCTTAIVLAHIVGLAKGTFNAYAFVEMWDPRPLYGVFIVPVIVSCFLVRWLLKIVHPQTGELVQMCSFAPATQEQIAQQRKAVKRTVAVTTVFLAFIVCSIALTLVSDAMVPYDIRLQAGEYGGHGGTWLGLLSTVLDNLLTSLSVWPVTMLFIYTLRLASKVSIAAAQYVISEIDFADQDIETDVAQALRLKIGPAVQTLVEEMLVPLSKGWGVTVAICVVVFVGLAFLNLPTLVDVDASDAAHQEAVLSCVFCALSAVAIVYPPAKVTTECEDIKITLNELRTAGVGSGQGMIDSKTNLDIEVIETYLSKLNKGQGPGFLLAGTVVSKSLVITLASKVAGYVAGAVQALQKVQQPAGTTAAVDDQLGIGTYTMTVTAQGTSIVGPN